MHQTEIILLIPCRNCQAVTNFTPLLELPSLSPRDNPRLRCEEGIHILQGKFSSLRQNKPEENSVSEVADAEDDVKAPATDSFNGNVGHLTDQGVECERGHCSDGNTFGACLGVEDFGANDPGERTDGRTEGEVVTPGHDDECPAGCVVVGGSRGEFGDEDRGNDLKS